MTMTPERVLDLIVQYGDARAATARAALLEKVVIDGVRLRAESRTPANYGLILDDIEAALSMCRCECHR